jgi:DNA polymerase III epsilon subunit-like protein
MTKFCILDTETTGLATTDQVIEVAYYIKDAATFTPKNIREFTNLDNIVDEITENTTVKRYRPNVSIHPGAFKVHNIRLKDLHGHKASKDIDVPTDISYLIGQNISFDIRLLKQSNENLSEYLDSLTTICTKNLSDIHKKKIGLTSTSLTNVFEHFEKENAEDYKQEYHSAIHDVFKTFVVLGHYCRMYPAISTWEELVSFIKCLKSVK